MDGMVGPSYAGVSWFGWAYAGPCCMQNWTSARATGMGTQNRTHHHSPIADVRLNAINLITHLFHMIFLNPVSYGWSTLVSRFSWSGDSTVPLEGCGVEPNQLAQAAKVVCHSVVSGRILTYAVLLGAWSTTVAKYACHQAGQCIVSFSLVQPPNDHLLLLTEKLLSHGALRFDVISCKARATNETDGAATYFYGSWRARHKSGLLSSTLA